MKNIIATLSKYLLPSMSHDFVKNYGSKLVQIETQSRKIEVMSKDYGGFRIAFAEETLMTIGLECPIGLVGIRSE